VAASVLGSSLLTEMQSRSSIDLVCVLSAFDSALESWLGTSTSWISLQLPGKEGNRLLLPVCGGVVVLDTQELQVHLLLMSDMERGFRAVAKLSSHGFRADNDIFACVSEPVRDLLVIASVTGLVLAFNLSGEVVCRLQAEPNVRHIAASHTGLAVLTESRMHANSVHVFDFR